MPRYFIEVSYKGTGYAGFQVQENAVTIQSEVERALNVKFGKSFQLTGASRTDAGVHALQNYFHFDAETDLFHCEASNLKENNTTANIVFSEFHFASEILLLRKFFR